MKNIIEVENGIEVTFPNGGISKSEATAEVNLPHVSNIAHEARILSHLSSGSLYLVEQLCDDGCKAYFNAETCKITNDGKLV